VQESLVELTRHNGVPIAGALCDFLTENFAPAFRTEGFAFFVRKGREIAALNLAQLTSLTPAAEGVDTQLDFCLAGDGGPIASIEVRDLAAPDLRPLVLDAKNARVTSAAVDRTGHGARALVDTTWPLRVPAGITRLSIRFPRAGATFASVSTVLYLKDANGKILGEIRIAE
jgi:hypothetical protein